MSECGEWHHDPEHRHHVQVVPTAYAIVLGCEPLPEMCVCGAQLIARHEFTHRHDVDLWWWWLPDGTFAPFPDRRPVQTYEDFGGDDGTEAWPAG